MEENFNNTTRTSMSKTNVKITATTTPLIFHVYQTFRSIKAIAKHFGAEIPIRRGFGYIGKSNASKSKERIAVWCPNLGKNKYWENILTDHGNTIIERKLGDTLARFQKGITSLTNDDLNTIRMTFVKYNGLYYFAGFFRISAIDFDNLQVKYRKVEVKVIATTYQKKKITISIEEEESTQTKLIFL